MAQTQARRHVVTSGQADSTWPWLVGLVPIGAAGIVLAATAAPERRHASAEGGEACIGWTASTTSNGPCAGDAFTAPRRR